MIWIIYFIKYNIEDDNPLVERGLNIDLSDVDYPAITICSEQTTKYALAERLANYLDPQKSLPDLLIKLKKKFLDAALDQYLNYEFSCKRNTIKGGYRPNESCKVSKYINILHKLL